MYFDFLCFTSGDKFLKFRSNTMDGSSGWGGGGGGGMWDVGSTPEKLTCLLLSRFWVTDMATDSVASW